MMNQTIGIKGATEIAHPDFSQDVSKDFQQQLAVLAQRYIILKDALVDSDSILGRSATETLLKQINDIDARSLSGDALTYWTEQSSHLNTHAQQLLAANTLDEQRQQFEFVSMALIHVLQAFGTTETPLYVQHCPMAFDDRGADWLAMEETIRNPYFGDRMLKCGRVTEVLAENTHQE
jgi:Cu(I)/Ag(I) efflux system membrane fusion protein